MRAAIYARVSTDKQEREGTSLESQAQRCDAYCQEQGWTIERVEQEQASGGNIDRRRRPKLHALLEWARAGEIDVIVCYDVDRLSRNANHTGWINTELALAGVEVKFVIDPGDPLSRGVKTLVGQGERSQLRERISRAKTQTALRGNYIPGGQPPFGYRFRTELIRKAERVVGLEEDPVRGPILREMFDFIAKGGTATGCAKWLNTRGIPTSRGGRWGHSSVVVIMRNTIYKGLPLTLRTRTVEDTVTGKIRLEARPDDERVALPTDIAPILVSPDLWRRANAQIDAGQTGARRKCAEPELWLLRSGFIFCGYCGGRLSAGKVRGVAQYSCKSHMERSCTNGGSMKAEILDDMVWNTVTLVLKDPAWIREQFQQQVDTTLPERISERRASLKRIREEEAMLASRLGLLDDATPVIARMNELSAARTASEREVDDLLLQQRETDQIAERINGFDRRFLDAYQRVDQIGYDEKRAILREFGVRVTLWKTDHDPRWTMDWAFDLGDNIDRWVPGDEEMPWVIFTRESAGQEPVFADSRSISTRSAMAAILP